jgi:hypothetical protein
VVPGRWSPATRLRPERERRRTRASGVLSFYAGDRRERIGVDRLQAALTLLEGIEAFRQGVTETRAADYSKYPSIFLPAVAGKEDEIERLLRAIDELVDRSE